MVKFHMIKFSAVQPWFTARKTTFSFSRRPEKMVFPKKLRWNMIFLVLLGKMIFLFPENMILHFKRKMKDDLSQKIRGSIIFSLNFPKRWPFEKGLHRHMIFLVLSGKMVMLSQKHDIFSLGRRWGGSFPGNTWKYDIFCVHVRVLQTCRHAPPSKKIKDVLIP